MYWTQRISFEKIDRNYKNGSHKKRFIVDVYTINNVQIVWITLQCLFSCIFDNNVGVSCINRSCATKLSRATNSTTSISLTTCLLLKPLYWYVKFEIFFIIGHHIIIIIRLSRDFVRYESKTIQICIILYKHMAVWRLQFVLQNLHARSSYTVFVDVRKY